MSRDREIEVNLENAAMDKEGWAIAYALLRCASAIQNVSYQLKSLGNADAATPMGALEAFGVVVKEAGERIADSLESIADKIPDVES